MGLSQSGRRSLSRVGVIAVSAVGHLTVLAIIALSIPKFVPLDPPAPNATNEWLMPRLTLEQPKPGSAARHCGSWRTCRCVPQGCPNRAVAAFRCHDRSGAEAGTAVWRRRASSDKHGRRDRRRDWSGRAGALRSRVACDALANELTAEQKDRCNQRFGQGALKGHKYIDPL